MVHCQNCGENLDEEAENWDLDKECVIHQYPEKFAGVDSEVKDFYCDPKCFVEVHGDTRD